MRIVEKKNLEQFFAVEFANKSSNILTFNSSPWLDLGDLPLSYSNTKTEYY